MEKRLHLHVPALSEMYYRQRLMEDPATMSYNAGYDLDFDGYHNDTGCIDFPRSVWKDAYARLVGNEPEWYYAYITLDEDDAFLGEVNLHRSRGEDWYDMGILLEADRRGMGYGREALLLLLDYAFGTLGAREVRNDFEASRTAALRLHRTCGFRKLGEEDGVLRLSLTAEEFFARRDCAFS